MDITNENVMYLNWIYFKGNEFYYQVLIDVYVYKC